MRTCKHLSESSPLILLAKPPVNQRINVRHLAYEPGSDLLFTLYAWGHSKGGLQYGLVHNAYAVVAANRRDGYLSEARDGGRIDAGCTDILDAGDYFHHEPRAGWVYRISRALSLLPRDSQMVSLKLFRALSCTTISSHPKWIRQTST